jgi:hypothetical protein
MPCKCMPVWQTSCVWTLLALLHSDHGCASTAWMVSDAAEHRLLDQAPHLVVHALLIITPYHLLHWALLLWSCISHVQPPTHMAACCWDACMQGR